MLRLSRSRVIEDIEFIINRHNPVLGQRHWTADGVSCGVEKHSYLGGQYSVHIDVLRLETLPATRPKWQLMIVNEFWQDATEATIRSTKWLKLLHGKQGDVIGWIARNRDNELAAALGAEESRVDR